MEIDEQVSSSLSSTTTIEKTTETITTNNQSPRKHEKKPFIILPLQEYFHSGDPSKPLMIHTTFHTLFKLSKNEGAIIGYLSYTFEFYKTSLQQKQEFARQVMISNMELPIDNHLLLLFEEGEEKEKEKEKGYSNENIIGFVLYYKGKDSITISQCLVKEESRRKNLGSTMITALFEYYLNVSKGINVIKVDAVPTLQSL